MAAWLVYTAQVALFTVAFYLLYVLLLSRETFCRFNRWAIWAMVGVAMAIPFAIGTSLPEEPFTIELPSTHIPAPEMPSQIVQVAKTLPDGSVATEDAAYVEPEHRRLLSLLPWAAGIYIIGVVALLVCGAVAQWRLWQIVRKGRREGDVIYTDRQVGPLNWWKFIVVNELPAEPAVVIHERAHVRHRHYIDVLLINLFVVWQWFNPAAWLLRRELRMVHEFEADADVLRASGSPVDARHYQMLLIRRSVGDAFFSLASAFNARSLARRIQMMNSRPSSPRRRWRLALFLPVAALIALACNESAAPQQAESVEEMTLAGIWKQTYATASGDTLVLFKTLSPDGYFYNVIHGPDGQAHVQQSGLWEQTSDTTYVEHMRLNRTGGPGSADVAITYRIDPIDRTLHLRFFMQGITRSEPFEEVWVKAE